MQHPIKVALTNFEKARFYHSPKENLLSFYRYQFNEDMQCPVMLTVLKFQLLDIGMRQPALHKYVTKICIGGEYKLFTKNKT